MLGSELAGATDFLLNRAQSNLGVSRNLGPVGRRVASWYVALFGVPEIGLRVRCRRALEVAPAQLGDVVDVGCGPGVLLGAIHRRRHAGRLVGIEPDATAAASCRRAHPYVELIDADVQSASMTLAQSFDTAFSIDVLEHIDEEDTPKFLAACRTLLRPGGTLVLHVPSATQHRHFKRFADWAHPDHKRVGAKAEELRAFCSVSGLEPPAIVPTFGSIATLAWELNMLSAVTAFQALSFPMLLVLAVAGERFPSSTHNGLLCVAKRPV
jgi:SAM-dependent methyltransferase